MAVPPEPVSLILKADFEKCRASEKPHYWGKISYLLPKAEIMRIL
jgi:hypothetical protein